MVEDKEPIRKVWENSSSGQKLVTVPQDSDIDVGDYVRLVPIDSEED